MLQVLEQVSAAGDRDGGGHEWLTQQPLDHNIVICAEHLGRWRGPPVSITRKGGVRQLLEHALGTFIRCLLLSSVLNHYTDPILSHSFIEGDNR